MLLWWAVEMILNIHQTLPYTCPPDVSICFYSWGLHTQTDALKYKFEMDRGRKERMTLRFVDSRYDRSDNELIINHAFKILIEIFVDSLSIAKLEKQVYFWIWTQGTIFCMCCIRCSDFCHFLASKLVISFSFLLWPYSLLYWSEKEKLADTKKPIYD